jgi:activating signal cointegrator 1
MKYKVLTLTQPWATLVALGAKKIETRSWATSYRGPLAIHAAKGLGSGGEQGLMELCRTEPFRSVLLDAGYLGTPVLPRGAIVAVCELIGCVPTIGTGPKGTDWINDLSDQERAFGDYTPGRYALPLDNVRALPEPIPARGALGLWTWEGDIGL